MRRTFARPAPPLLPPAADRMNRTILKNGILVALASVALMTSLEAQDLPPGFPRDGSKKVLENSRVIIWDATWPKGKAVVLHQHPVDYLSVTLVEGVVKVTGRDGTSSLATAPFGAVRFNRAGTTHSEEGVSDQQRRAIMVELKTVPSPAEAAVTGSGFPRDGATKALENERVAVWDATWVQGQRIPKRRQGRDAVVIFLKGGVIRQSPEGAAVRDTRRNVGDVLYIPAGTDVPSEEATQDPPRAVFIELK
jgi:quercetin dioxygenase-like cupin family protein